MLSTPLHPAVVHVPLGLTFVIPLLALGFSVLLWRGETPRRLWGVIVFLQILVLAAGILAIRTGQAEEDRVEKVVAERTIEAHEDGAILFVWMTAAALASSLLVMMLPERARRWSVTAAVALSLVAAGLAFRAGHSGGELVYVHGAASAHVSAQTRAAPDFEPREEHGERD